MAMLNNFSMKFVGGRADAHTGAFPANRVVSPDSASRSSATGIKKHVSSELKHSHVHSENFKTALNQASNNVSLPKQNVSSKNKTHKDNKGDKKNDGLGLVLYANMHLRTNEKQTIIGSSSTNGGNISKNDASDKKGVKKNNLKGDMKNKKPDKHADDNLLNKNTIKNEITVINTIKSNLHSFSEIDSNKRSKGVLVDQLNKARIISKHKDVSDLKSGKAVNKGSIKGKSNLVVAMNFALHNYEKRSNLAHSHTKTANSFAITKGMNFLSNSSVLHSTLGNLNVKHVGQNIASGQMSNFIPENSESSGAITVNSVMFMIKKNIQSAVITLKPPSLGHVKVEIAMENVTSNLNDGVNKGKTITINMLAQNDAAKNILQSSSPNLQNTLKGQGFSSVNLNINLSSGGNDQGRGNNSGVNKNTFTNFGGGLHNTDKDGIVGSSSVANMQRYIYNPLAIVDYFV